MPTVYPAPYNLSFTAASLRPELARIVAEHYLAAGDWATAKSQILASNALQARSPASGIRLERELRQRIERLSEPQLRLLAGSTGDDRAAMAWLAAMKQNALVFELASEVLRDKLDGHDTSLRPSDYEGFLASMSTEHPEILALAETTRTKVRRVLLRMLTEAGILTKGAALGELQRPVMSMNADRAIRADNARWLAGFLLSDAEITRT
ncbi:DUF1819 family protein [Gemmatimonas sp.]|uniref:DUF1819 family protein n=1 Tax=Gemmatimonas sp. TaxID=1962908 RepID=UPI003565CC87